MKRKVYVTTAIPYVNARPHLGFALELVQADAIARYHRLLGDPTRFQTGTDENALKNVLAAREHAASPHEWVDEHARFFRSLVNALHISADDFVRTTEDRHQRAVHCLWKRLHPEDIFLKEYIGRYCTACEDFILEKNLIDGLCPEHGTRPLPVSERNYFFRLSAYQRQIEDLLRSGRLCVIPEKRLNEVLSFVRDGLQDFSISRAAERSGGWGIPVPGDPSQVIYVWVDALTNYLTGTGFGTSDNWSAWWGSGVHKIHVIGKNVWKFHAVYWPALLLSAGLPLPDEIVVHGFITQSGQKISKSLGNTVDPFSCVDALGVDGIRLYLLQAMPPFEDGDYSSDRARQLYNTLLANGLGNLVSRTTTLAERSDYGAFHASSSPEAPAGYHEALRSYQFDRALGFLWDVISNVNRAIEQAAPWKALKDGNRTLLSEYLDHWLARVHQVSYWLQPLLPDAGRRVLEVLSTGPIRASGAIFPRLP